MLVKQINMEHRAPNPKYKDSELDTYFGQWLKDHDRLMAEFHASRQQEIVGEAQEIGGVVIRPIFGNKNENHAQSIEHPDQSASGADNTRAASA